MKDILITITMWLPICLAGIWFFSVATSLSRIAKALEKLADKESSQ